MRTIQLNGETWFVVSDICDILNLGTITRVVERLDEDELSQTQVIDKMGRKQQMHICNESGVYNLILRSDKPEAKSFKKWITKEVLPTIRKTGSYSLQGKTQLEALLVAVQQVVDQEKKIREHDLKLAEHEERILIPRLK
ncbi:MAG: BRO family protein [Microscillaceae bacterium]|nr:BRO family protein [Microscillaceae bacterium]